MSVVRLRAAALAIAVTAAPAMANDEAIEAMEEYLEFVDYGGATFFPEQIPR